MIQVKTQHFGTLDIDPAEILHFPAGIAPFTLAQRYVLLSREDEAPFVWLQSADQPELAFVCAPLQVLFPGELDALCSTLMLSKNEQENSIFLVILTLKEAAEGATANLLAPIFIDRETRQGRQIIRDAGLELCRVPIARA